ncbi:hypothetical protein SADUNF_Sadunf10G0109300 [Salix dunnii]|uniref:Nicotianamine synthase n=1 Tax=Salix dunnii TaxID=1413687 RepID=A0A835JTK1_9ROSI|nr:hypothetical protein SADUNF_Sadunf10G0109300 [Salix dunnii]
MSGHYHNDDTDNHFSLNLSYIKRRLEGYLLAYWGMVIAKQVSHSSVPMGWQQELLIEKVCEISGEISSLKQYAVVFQSALVGMNKKEKVKVTKHLAKHVSWIFPIASEFTWSSGTKEL